MRHVIDELQGPVGDEVGEVVPGVVVAVVLHDPVVVEGVVVVAAVPHQSHPLAPAGRNVAARILVKILAEIRGPEATITEKINTMLCYLYPEDWR